MLAIGPTDIPGITTADALDANDQLGSILAISVPISGVIEKALLLDPGAQGAALEVYLFSASVTLAASDAAFSISDADLTKLVGVLATGTYKDLTAGKAAPLTPVLPVADGLLTYVAPSGVLYAAVKTTATPTYTTPAWPQIYMEISPR